MNWPVLQLCGRREHMLTNVQFCLLMCRKRWFQFNSRVIRTHFSSRMTLNIWKVIAKTLSRRHVCLNSLICRFVTLSYDVSERKWFSARCYCDAIYRRVILFACGMKHIPPHLLMSREDYEDDVSSVLLHSMLSNANQRKQLRNFVEISFGIFSNRCS